MKKRITQSIFFLGITVLLSRIVYENLPGYILAFSPATHLGNSVAIVQGKINFLLLVPAVLAIIMACVLPKRSFCFYVCPIGFLQDCIPSARTPLTLLRKYPALNYSIFFFLFILSLTGINALGLFDPLTIYARVVNAFPHESIVRVIIFCIPLIIILLVHMVWQRLWCFGCCPLGTCFDAAAAVKKGFLRIPSKTAENSSRRAFIKTSVAGLLLSFGLKRISAASVQNDLIRPPGALQEHHFKDMCIRCGNCLKACITGGLQPALFESGWDGIYTPRLVPRIGECDEYCTRCGEACPTQAIRALSLDEKRAQRIGLAAVDKKKCLGWENDQHCFICGEFCPYGALDGFMKNGNIPCPIVKADVCRGCGICEKQCPTHAIKVYRNGIKSLSDTIF